MKYMWNTIYESHVQSVIGLIGRQREEHNPGVAFQLEEASNVPIQANGNDCGIMVAKNIQHLICPSLGRMSVMPELTPLYRAQIALSLIQKKIICY